MQTDFFSEGHERNSLTGHLSSTGPSYYDILSIDAKASKLKIREAYLRLKNLYSGTSDALYSVAEGDSVQKNAAELEEAFRVLNDDTTRAEYDRKMGFAADRPATKAGATTDEQLENLPLSGRWVLEAGQSFTGGMTPSEFGAVSGSGVIVTTRSTLKIIRTTADGSAAQNVQDVYARIAEESDPGDGDIIRKFREASGVSEGEVQERTKISLEYIRSIENNRFERLPQVVYVKGFIRSVLRYLQVPALERYVTAYAARLGEWQGKRKS